MAKNEEEKKKRRIEREIEETRRDITEMDITKRTKKKGPQKQGREDEEEPEEERDEGEDQEERDDEEEKEKEEEKDKDEEGEGEEEPGEEAEKGEDVGEAEGTGEAQEAGKAAGKTGVEGAGAETAGTTAGGAAAEGAGAAAEGAAAEGAGGILAALGPYLPVIIAILAVVIVLIVIAIIVLGGSSATDLPDESNPNDRMVVAQAACNAGECQPAQEELSNQAKEAGEEVKDSVAFLKRKRAVAATPQQNSSLDDLNKKIDLIEQNFQALTAVEGDSQRAQELTLDNHQLISQASEIVSQNEDLPEQKELLEELADLTTNNQQTLRAMSHSIFGQNEPIIDINRLDLRLLLDYKIDIRAAKLINHIAKNAYGQEESELLKTNSDQVRNIISSGPIKRTQGLKNILGPNPEWQTIEISRITQFEPESKEAEVTRESEANRSAHYSARALDISIAGNYKCTKKGWFDSDTSWHPCKVAYQTDYRPNYANNYARGETLTDFATLRGPGESQELDLDQMVIKAGLGEIASKMDIEARYLEDRGLDTDNIGEALIESQLGLPANSIVSGEGNPDYNLGQAYIEQALGLPAGSLDDSQSIDKVLTNAGLNHLREQIGLPHSSWNGDFNNKQIGQAVIDNIYRESVSQEKLEELIATRPIELKRRLGLEDLPQTADELIKAAGESFKDRLFTSQTSRGLSLSMGLEKSAIESLETNREKELKRIGLTVTARSLMPRESKQDPRTISQEELFDLISKGDIKQVPGLSKQDVASIINADSSSQREEEIKKVGQKILEQVETEKLNRLLREAAAQVAGVDYYQLKAENLKDLLSNKDKLNQLIEKAGNKQLDRTFKQYQPTIKGYQITTYDWEDIKNGNWQNVVGGVGAATVESELGLPGNSLRAVFNGTLPTEEALARGGLTLFLRNLGITNTNSYDWFDEENSRSLDLQIGQALVESRGLSTGSFDSTLEEVLKQNEAAQIAAAFNLSKEEAEKLMRGEIDVSTIESKAAWVDGSLGLNNGATTRLLKGDLSVKNFSQQVALANLAGIDNEELKDIVAMDEIPDVGVGNLGGVILEGGNQDKVEEAFGLLLDRYVGEKYGWPDDLFISQIRNDKQSREQAFRAGMERFSIILAGGDRSQAQTIETLLNRAYKDGESLDSQDYINAGLSYFGPEGARITDEDGEFFTGLFEGRTDLSLDHLQTQLMEDASSDGFVGLWLDHKLEEATGLNKDEIEQIEDQYQSWKNDSLDDEELLTTLNNNFQVIDRELVETVRGENSYEEMAKLYFSDDFKNITGMSFENAEQLNQLYNSWQEGGVDDQEFYSTLAGGLGVDEEVVRSANLANNMINGGQFGASGYGFIAYQTGIGQEIDEAVGIRGFTSGAITFAATGNPIPLAMAVFGDFLGIGKTKCQDPQKVTREHVRQLTTWVLQSDEEFLPRQIGLFRKEDVNYFNGLTGEGEPAADRQNLVEIKYGPLDQRGNKGVFSNKHMWNHIHIGY